MKTAISIPDALFDAAESFANRMGISRSKLYQNALQSYLAAQRDDSVTDTLNALYETERRGVDESLQTAQLKSLPDEDWD